MWAAQGGTDGQPERRHQQQVKIMKQFLGTKLLLAVAMTRGEYNEHRGWPAPKDEDQTTPGYLVEYQDGGAPNHPKHAGYISWSPADVFEKAYRPTNGLNFGLALEALKAGHRVRRAGWADEDMWLSVSCNGKRSVQAEHFWSPHNREHARWNGGAATVLPCITLKTATGEIQMGWLASQSDMLADDWQLVEEKDPTP